MTDRTETTREPGDALVLETPVSRTVVVPAHMVVEFELVGGGGAGGHWGGGRGGGGARVAGTLPAVSRDRTFVAQCGAGGRVSTDTGGGGPALGGEGGSGHVAGGAGGWGSNWAGGGGGGGGGASALVATDGSVRIVAAGGGGGGGGGEDPGAPGAVSGTPGDVGSPDDPADRIGTTTPAPTGSGGAAAGANGRSRRRIAGGGGGGGGGGAGVGSGGSGGVGGGSGGPGGNGAVSSIGASAVVVDVTDLTDPDRAPFRLVSTPGAGGMPGAAAVGGTDPSPDARLGSPGLDGLVRVSWAPPGRLAARLLGVQRGDVSDAPDPVDRDRPARVGTVVERPVDGGRRLESGEITRFVELGGDATDVWAAADGSRSIAGLARVDALRGHPDERLDEVVATVTTLRQRGFFEPARAVGPRDGRRPMPHGIGYDLVGATYPLGDDPTGRPGSVDLLRHAFVGGTATHAALNELIDTLRGTIGPDRIIWALKHVDGRIRFEFYLFADAGTRHVGGLPGLFTDTVTVFEGLAGWDAPRRFPGAPTLVSFEFDVDPGGRISTPASIDASYNVPGSVDFVVNYELDGTTERFKSISQGFDVTYQRNLLADRLGSSRGADAGSERSISDFWLARIDDARECERCWVSFKTFSDGVYLSRAHVDDLVAFLEEFAYPDHLRSWVTDQRQLLDHLRYDLCFDYTVVGRSVRANRTAFCGWF